MTLIRGGRANGALVSAAPPVLSGPPARRSGRPRGRSRRRHQTVVPPADDDRVVDVGSHVRSFPPASSGSALPVRPGRGVSSLVFERSVNRKAGRLVAIDVAGQTGTFGLNRRVRNEPRAAPGLLRRSRRLGGQKTRQEAAAGPPPGDPRGRRRRSSPTAAWPRPDPGHRRACGVSPGLILYYFGSKDRLLVEALTFANDQSFLAPRGSCAGCPRPPTGWSG